MAAPVWPAIRPRAPQPGQDALDRQVDARTDAESECGAVSRDVVAEPVEFVGPPAHEMQHRADSDTTRFSRAGISKSPARITGTVIHATTHILHWPANIVFLAMTYFAG